MQGGERGGQRAVTHRGERVVCGQLRQGVGEGAADEVVPARLPQAFDGGIDRMELRGEVRRFAVCQPLHFGVVNLVALHRPHRLAVKEAAPSGGEGFLLAGVEVEVHEFAVIAGGVAQGHVQHPLAPLDEVGVQHFAVDLYGGAVAQGGDGGDVRAVFVAQRQVGE